MKNKFNKINFIKKQTKNKYSLASAAQVANYTMRNRI